MNCLHISTQSSIPFQPSTMSPPSNPTTEMRAKRDEAISQARELYGHPAPAPTPTCQPPYPSQVMPATSMATPISFYQLNPGAPAQPHFVEYLHAPQISSSACFFHFSVSLIDSYEIQPLVINTIFKVPTSTYPTIKKEKIYHLFLTAMLYFYWCWSRWWWQGLQLLQKKVEKNLHGSERKDSPVQTKHPSGFLISLLSQLVTNVKPVFHFNISVPTLDLTFIFASTSCKNFTPTTVIDPLLLGYHLLFYHIGLRPLKKLLDKLKIHLLVMNEIKVQNFSICVQCKMNHLEFKLSYKYYFSLSMINQRLCLFSYEIKIRCFLMFQALLHLFQEG
ncbi:hypothetical protein VP01_2335g1 [Puccinia sorghi]|uniref:AKL18 protein n=1 Tax=Puccinia sorghi TaxID=27349 RepID=A0A0L6V7E1_9BASI|nr:hypothetical protein VP01_2335g1 [Puccinia sorghi]